MREGTLILRELWGFAFRVVFGFLSLKEGKMCIWVGLCEHRRWSRRWRLMRMLCLGIGLVIWVFHDANDQRMRLRLSWVNGMHEYDARNEHLHESSQLALDKAGLLHTAEPTLRTDT